MVPVRVTFYRLGSRLPRGSRFKSCLHSNAEKTCCRRIQTQPGRTQNERSEDDDRALRKRSAPLVQSAQQVAHSISAETSIYN